MELISEFRTAGAEELDGIFDNSLKSSPALGLVALEEPILRDKCLGASTSRAHRLSGFFKEQSDAKKD